MTDFHAKAPTQGICNVPKLCNLNELHNIHSNQVLTDKKIVSDNEKQKRNQEGYKFNEKNRGLWEGPNGYLVLPESLNLLLL